MTQLLKTRRLKVSSPRNSYCGSAKLSDLDWSQWWTDGRNGALYFHVRHKDGEAVHRVYCCKTMSPRLAMKNGELYWLVRE